MYVSERMTRYPATVMPNYSVSKAYQIMTEGHFEQCQKEFPSILHRIRVEG